MPARERRLLADSIDAFGPERIVLHRAETEAALAWGRQYGIRRFQGRHVDAMLAAERITTCSFARACTLRQCIDRAAATGAAGRAGCDNTARLDGIEAQAAVAIPGVKPSSPERLAALVADCAAAGVTRQAMLLRIDRLPPGLSRPHHIRLAEAALTPLLRSPPRRTVPPPGSPPWP